jgi:hypothetical protein
MITNKQITEVEQLSRLFKRMGIYSFNELFLAGLLQCFGY